MMSRRMSSIIKKNLFPSGFEKKIQAISKEWLMIPKRRTVQGAALTRGKDTMCIKKIRRHLQEHIPALSQEQLRELSLNS